MIWIPFVTFWQVTMDMLEPVDVAPGHGHSYTLEFVDGWATVMQPPGWTAEHAASVAIDHRARLGMSEPGERVTRSSECGPFAGSSLMVGWIGSYQRRWLRADLIAGVAVAALIVPKNLGYAGIAGIPLQNGLMRQPPVPCSTRFSGAAGRSRRDRVQVWRRWPPAPCPRRELTST